MSPPLSDSPSAVLSATLEIAEKQILPRLRKSVSEGKGNRAFAAAVLRKLDLTPVTVSVNQQQESPLLHGETNCIREFFMVPADERPPTTECVFFATHEPCALCLSGIGWTNFPIVYYLFTYGDTRDLLEINGDIEILEEVFRVPAPGDTEETLAARPLYNKRNKYFTAQSLADLLENVEDGQERHRLEGELQRVRDLYTEFNRAAESYAEIK